MSNAYVYPRLTFEPDNRGNIIKQHNEDQNFHIADHSFKGRYFSSLIVLRPIFLLVI